MSALWTSQDAAAATGGRSTCAWEANGVSIDTREIQAGDLFVALKDVRDGHDFVAQALENGAAAALVSHIPDGVPADAPLLIVEDVLTALQAMGIAARARTKAKVIGVTGSVGKTSTKEMLRSVLTRQGKVHAAERSFNNHWGVPLTLARMPADSNFAVIEIGMNHPGEIAPLSKMARPHVAMITNVAAAHMAAFDGLDGIAQEKASIFDGVEQGGVAVVNGDMGTTPILMGYAATCGLTCVRFGETDGNDFTLLETSFAQNMTIALGRIATDVVMFKVNSLGKHFLINGLGVLAVVRALDLDVALAANDMALWVPPMGRGVLETVLLDAVERDQTLDLIDDAYNANPTSLGASLDILAASQPKNGLGRIETGRRIAMLGDMLELGADEAALHAQMANHTAMADIDTVHCFGPLMRALWEALPDHKRGQWCEKSAELAAIVHQLVDAGDVVLVKGSLGSKARVVVDAIQKLGQSAKQEQV